MSQDIIVDKNPGTVEADTELGEQSDYESLQSETTSLASSIFDYKYENGRRYHKFREGAYVLPNDETEQDRLDIVHHMYALMLDGKITLVPETTKFQRILDVGTGTGIWAIDAADMWPSAEVIGTDLSPIQPSWVPPNCKFEVDDCESEWTFPKNSFDFVHSRHLAQSLKDWPTYFKNIYEHTKPGGYVEVVEAEMLINTDDDTYPEKCDLRTFIDTFNIALDKMGIPECSAKLKKFAEEAGFVDVTANKYKIPWGPWPKDRKMKELGRWCLLNASTGFEAYGLALMVRYGGFTAEEAKRVCEGCMANIRSKDIHVYNNHWVVVGRKPEEPKEA